MPKILHFEDDKVLSDMFAIKFKQVGFEYVNYESPTDNPVDLIKKENPDLIIMDIIMPIMNGFTATKLIMADRSINTIPIIGLTNMNQDTDVNKGLGLGMKDYMIKASFTPSQMIQKIGKILNIEVKIEEVHFPPIKPNYSIPSIQDDSPHEKKEPDHKKLYITLSIIAVIILAAILPPFMMPKVKSGIVISDKVRNEILLAVDTHFDHPAERLLVLRYQITEKSEWRGADRYFVSGITIFGIKFNMADVYVDGGIINIPSLENDIITN
ncbi:MAG: response regulator [Patescibacteria group bacterium]